MTERRNKLMNYIKKLGWAGFLFFLIKGLTLYVFIPFMVARGLINCE